VYHGTSDNGCDNVDLFIILTEAMAAVMLITVSILQGQWFDTVNHCIIITVDHCIIITGAMV